MHLLQQFPQVTILYVHISVNSLPFFWETGSTEERDNIKDIFMVLFSLSWPSQNKILDLSSVVDITTMSVAQTV
jgi:hypothetical protein